MKNNVLKILKMNKGEFISGEKISDELKISRAAVWKHINALKDMGYNIESVSKKGYKINSEPDILSYDEICEYLDTETIGRSYYYYDTIDSTNNECKRKARDNFQHGTVLVAEAQTMGKGRIGRRWSSPKGTGIWMSVLLKPNISPMEASKLTLLGAVAIYNAFEEMNIKSQIKWPNDVVINGKKVCGILTEMNAEIDMINYVILGIGINVNTEIFPEDIVDKATSIRNETGKIIDRKILIGKVMNNIEALYYKFLKDNDFKYILNQSRKASVVIGKEVKIITRVTEEIGRAIDIDDDGHLIVELQDGTKKNIMSGEVSVRGLYGYI